MYDFKQLEIWRRSHVLAVEIHAAIRGRGRGYSGLIAQLGSSAASVPSNIAESAGYDSPAQSVRFIDIAIGSLSETENHLEMASATGLIHSAAAARFIKEVRELRRMCLGFRKWLLSAK